MDTRFINSLLAHKQPNLKQRPDGAQARQEHSRVRQRENTDIVEWRGDVCVNVLLSECVCVCEREREMERRCVCKCVTE